MSHLIALLIYSQLIFSPQQTPYRDESTYKLSLKMEFKADRGGDTNDIDYGSTTKENRRPRLYLNASLQLLTLQPDDYKLKVVNSNSQVLKSMKIKAPTTVLFDLGYVDDMKYKKSAHTFTIHFIDKKKKIASQIFLEIKENGDFFVNSKRFGKV